MGYPPFTRPVPVAGIAAEGIDREIEASPAEREDLARFLRLSSIGRLHGAFRLRPARGGVVEVAGTVEADVTQICVATLEPFETAVSEPVVVRFAPRRPEVATSARHAPEKEAEARPESRQADLEEPDPLTDGRIDLGALATEFLALGLDPYPRKPGAAFAEPGEAEASAAHPFAGLRKLRRTGAAE